MQEQVRKLLKRFEKIEELLGQEDVLLDQKRYRELTQEHAYLSQVKELSEHLERLQTQIQENEILLKTEKNSEFQEMIREEIVALHSAVVL